MDTNLKSYITKYDKWLDEKTIAYSSRVIPVKASLENVKHVLPTNQAEQILANADCITLANCICRQKYKNCDNPLDVCFMLNRSGEQLIEKGLSRLVSLDQARETLKLANESGLVHMTLYKPDHEVFALCSCCACCCHDLQLVLSYGKQYILMHADFIAQDDPDLCLHCGACVDRCQFNARKLTADTLSYQASLCYGCGLCITTCPANAIQIKPRIWSDIPPALDWVIFDEASQIPLPQALLSLIYTRGNFLFLGDVNQLPPIVRGKYEDYTGEHSLNQSILANFLEIYPPSHQEALNITYRMNKEICAFPGKTWYKRLECPAESNAHGRLSLKNPRSQRSLDFYDQILDPEKPVVLVMTKHQGCSQKSDLEADLMAALAHRLMTCHGILPDQMALISPHRAQNNTILKTLGDLLDGSPCGIPWDLGLLCVDTVERVQGAERDIIIFGIASSDPDHIFSDNWCSSHADK